MDYPLVTVYITNYNYEKYIEQSIASVRAQTLQDYELIIIDDGSTDGSREIIETYRGTPKTTIIYQQNKGLNITNNVAMRASTGKYIVRLDADDFLVPTALQEMTRVLEANDELGLVFPDYYYVDADGEITGEERRHNFEKEVSLFDQPAHGACTMIRLSFLKKIGGYNESFTCQDGYDLWLKFITHYSVSNINKPLFYYRRHGENLTTNEERILATRRAIKETFIDKRSGTNATLVIIPVRNTSINGESWPLFKVDGKTILARKVDMCLAANTAAMVAITSSSPEILVYAKQAFKGNPQVAVVERPARLAGMNQTLGKTIALTLDEVLKTGVKLEYVITASLEYPFVEHGILDDMVNTLLLFKVDSVLSVRPDNRMYYQHTGHTLKPILEQDQFTKMEREAIYKGAGGLVISSIESFKKYGKINGGKTSHVVVDEQTAFGVFSEFDFILFKKYIARETSSLLEDK